MRAMAIEKTLATIHRLAGDATAADVEEAFSHHHPAH